MKPVAGLAGLLLIASVGAAHAQRQDDVPMQPQPQPQPPPNVGQPYGTAPYGTPPPPQGPPEMKYRDDLPIPPGYHVEERMRIGLVVGGSITFGVFYLPSLMYGVQHSEPYNRWLVVPVLGPLLSIGSRKKCSSDTDCIGEGFIDFFLVFDFIGQAAGAGMLLPGVLATKKVLVRNDTVMGQKVEWTLAPTTFGGRGAGLGVQGVVF